ncbi:MAG: LysE family transporter [Candidatus Sumerlaeota bacterium]|nr:LysE family transporter [Candidatus Sumerlaeota bacterium]
MERTPTRGLCKLFLLAFVTGFSGAAMPGPFLVAAIQQTAVQGMRAIFGLLAGHMLLELATVGLLALGLQAVILRRGVRGAAGIVGGLALFCMGAGMIRGAAGLSLNLEGSAGAACSMPQLMLLGAAVCAANPYYTGWWATIGAGQLAHMAIRTPTDYAVFYLGHLSADILWYGLVGLLVVTGRRWLTDDVYRSLIVSCAAILLAIAAWFLFAGFNLLRKREIMETVPGNRTATVIARAHRAGRGR